MAFFNNRFFSGIGLAPIALTASWLFMPAAAHAQNWVVTREHLAPDTSAACVLQSKTSDGIALRIDGTVDIVSDFFLDERADRSSVTVDSGAIFPAQQRLPSSPHALILSGANTSFDTEFVTPQLVREFRRGHHALVTIETILDGPRQTTISLSGFTAAYERYTSCRSHFAEPTNP